MGFGIKKDVTANVTPSTIVYFDQLTPTTIGVVFDPDTPETIDVLYVSSINASTWIWDGSAYVSYVAPTTASTEWYLINTAIDAGSNKTAMIYRNGAVAATSFNTKRAWTYTGASDANKWWRVFDYEIAGNYAGDSFKIQMNEFNDPGGSGKSIIFDIIVKRQDPSSYVTVNIDSGATTFDLSNFDVRYNSTTKRLSFYYRLTTTYTYTNWLVLNSILTSNLNYRIIWYNTLIGASLSGVPNDPITSKTISLNKINGVYTLPATKATVAGQVLADPLADGNLAWATISSAIPQANKIYVDSVNGINSTGRGNINTPYLTPEYALADITNTGTITATTTLASATLTVVSSTANIVVGQFITGTGIPYGSTVVSKTVNTIVLSQVATASATITATWWTVYEVILNGSFVATSNLTKQGFYIVNNGRVIWGNFTLFNLNAIFVIPHKLLGKGDYFGTSSSSVFHDITAQQIAGFTYDLDHGIVDTIGTGYAIHHTSNLGVVNYIGSYVNAKFGYVLYVETSGFANISFNSYGLLGGIRANSSACYVTLSGNVTCPTSILALNLGSSLVTSNCDIIGSTTASRWAHTGNLQGTTHTIGGATINSGYCSGQIVASGGHNILNIVDSTGVASLLQNATSTVVNNGYIVNVSQTAGTLINNGTINTGFLARGTCVNNGVISCADGLTIGIGTVFQNFGKIVTRIDTTGAGWRFENNSYLEVSNTNIDLSTNGTFVNRGRIYNPTTADDVFNITSSGVVLENYGEIQSGTVNTTKAIISKSTGTVKLFSGSKLVVANASSPIKCTANTSASKDIYLFNCIDNCNGTTYGLGFAFDGSSFAPNDLVGGTLYENVNY
jgi:hypothetical protein